MKRLSVRVDDRLHQRVRIKCAEEDLTIEGALKALIEEWVGVGKPPPPPAPRVNLPPGTAV